MELQPTHEEQVAEALRTVNDCLVAIGNRIEALEKHVNEMPTPDKTYYKPSNKGEYLSLKENLDHIYYRLNKLEHGM